jgi:hypothetical protein
MLPCVMDDFCAAISSITKYITRAVRNCATLLGSLPNWALAMQIRSNDFALAAGFPIRLCRKDYRWITR